MQGNGVRPLALSPGAGKAIWFLGGLMMVKADGEQTGGPLSVVENLLPAGFAPPLHVHRDTDEPY